MSHLETHIKSINEKLQQLIKSFAAQKKENDNLKEELKKIRQKEEEYKLALRELDQKVNILKVASGQIDGPEKKEFEKRINRYLKEIDKCIGMLSE